MRRDLSISFFFQNMNREAPLLQGFPPLFQIRFQYFNDFLCLLQLFLRHFMRDRKKILIIHFFSQPVAGIHYFRNLFADRAQSMKHRIVGTVY